MSLKYRFFASAAALVTATPALAQVHDPHVIIVTGSSEAEEAQEQVNKTPGGADVVGYEDYADKSLASLRDALAFSPGVYLQPRFGQEVRISIRGSGLSRSFHMRGLTLLQDGVPINLADDNGDFQELDPIFFDHLEVYRGSNALRFGSGTLGGAINGVTPTGVDARGLFLRGDVGAFDSYRGLASYGGVSGDGKGDVDYWAAISADSSDGDRDHAKRDSIRFHGNVGMRFSDAIRTRVYASVNSIDQQLPGSLDYNTAKNDPKTGSFFRDTQRNIDSIRLQNRTTFDLGSADLNVGIFYNGKSLDHPITPFVIDNVSRDKGAYFRLNWLNGPVELTIGGEARFGDTDAKRFQNIDGKRGNLIFDADQKARTMSVYGEARYRPADRWTVIAGGIFSDGMRKQQQTFNNGPTNDLGKADFSEFSPKVGILFDATDTIQFYGNVSRSAEFPGFSELAQIATFVPVQAQTAWTYEIGTRGDYGMAEWDLSLYRSEIDGELLQFTVGGDIPASTFNADKTIHQGIEAGLTLNFAHWLRLSQIYTYSDFRFDDDAQYGDNRLPVIPKHFYRAELRFGSDAFHIAPNVEWVPKGAWADYNNTFRTESYALVGLTASAAVAKNAELFVDARNILDEEAVGDVGAAITANENSVIFYPVERRGIFGGVRLRFD